MRVPERGGNEVGTRWMVKGAYHKLSLRAKQAAARVGMGAPQPTRCPACGMAVMASQLEAHQAERCPGEQVVRFPVRYGELQNHE
jgi:hypothetical protein